MWDVRKFKMAKRSKKLSAADRKSGMLLAGYVAFWLVIFGVIILTLIFS